MRFSYAIKPRSSPSAVAFQYQQAKLGYIQAQALRLQDTAALFVALGGGWWNGPATVVGANPNQAVKTGALAAGH